MTETTRERHYVEAFMDDTMPGWGWQCFDCPSEQFGFATIHDAELAGDLHAVGVQQ